VNAFADTFFLIARRHKYGDGWKDDWFILMSGSMKENNIAQDDNQNNCLKIDKTHDHSMSEITSHT
jgi:hypothetical protein